ncbi:MAG: hypothetical protein MUC98_00170 [Desulfobacterota bacterium]|nr:hypothetical protein [Thermodesulfobacteriota bacterium]
MHRINGADRPPILLTKTERPLARQREGFALYLNEQLRRGATPYMSWKKVVKEAPDDRQKTARPLAERSRLRSAGVINDLSRRGRAPAREKTSGPGPSSEGRSANRASLPGRYSRLDCYEFVAAVLEENGIRYYGKDGVGNALVAKAKMEHKPSNHFLTGEGLTRLLSSDAVSVNVKGDSVEQTWEILEPRLKEGAILSFSSQRAGHTGIVGFRNGRWVFINSSGRLGDRSSYRVKEEDLGEEIRSRLAKAKNEKTSLSITLGRVDRELAAAYRKSESVSVAEMRKGSVNLLA